MALKGKIAIVTGGNSGIGKVVALALARQGANIVIDYVAHPEATEELEKQLAALGDKCIGVDADVSRMADLEKLIRATVEKKFNFCQQSRERLRSFIPQQRLRQSHGKTTSNINFTLKTFIG